MLEPPDTQGEASLPPPSPPASLSGGGYVQLASNTTTATDGYEVAQSDGVKSPPPVNPRYPSAERLANIIYNETSSLRELPSGRSLSELRDAMAHALLNRFDQGVTEGRAKDVLKVGEREAIFKNKVPEAVAAYTSSLAAAKAALARTAVPTTGIASAFHFNNRPTGSTGPNLTYNPPARFLDTFGPYRNVSPTKDAPANSSYFAFFEKP